MTYGIRFFIFLTVCHFVLRSILSLPNALSCSYTLRMLDDGGDGFDGASITVKVGGAPRLTDEALQTGSSRDVIFYANQGDHITSKFSSGTHDEEITYQILDDNSNIILTRSPVNHFYSEEHVACCMSEYYTDIDCCSVGGDRCACDNIQGEWLVNEQCCLSGDSVDTKCSCEYFGYVWNTQYDCCEGSQQCNCTKDGGLWMSRSDCCSDSKLSNCENSEKNLCSGAGGTWLHHIRCCTLGNDKCSCVGFQGLWVEESLCCSSGDDKCKCDSVTGSTWDQASSCCAVDGDVEFCYCGEQCNCEMFDNSWMDSAQCCSYEYADRCWCDDHLLEWDEVEDRCNTPSKVGMIVGITIPVSMGGAILAMFVVGNIVLFAAVVYLSSRYFWEKEKIKRDIVKRQREDEFQLNRNDEQQNVVEEEPVVASVEGDFSSGGVPSVEKKKKKKIVKKKRIRKKKKKIQPMVNEVELDDLENEVVEEELLVSENKKVRKKKKKQKVNAVIHGKELEKEEDEIENEEPPVVEKTPVSGVLYVKKKKKKKKAPVAKEVVVQKKKTPIQPKKVVKKKIQRLQQTKEPESEDYSESVGSEEEDDDEFEDSSQPIEQESEGEEFEESEESTDIEEEREVVVRAKPSPKQSTPKRKKIKKIKRVKKVKKVRKVKKPKVEELEIVSPKKKRKKIVRKKKIKKIRKPKVVEEPPPSEEEEGEFFEESEEEEPEEPPNRTVVKTKLINRNRRKKKKKSGNPPQIFVEKEPVTPVVSNHPVSKEDLLEAVRSGKRITRAQATSMPTDRPETVKRISTSSDDHPMSTSDDPNVVEGEEGDSESEYSYYSGESEEGSEDVEEFYVFDQPGGGGEERRNVPLEPLLTVAEKTPQPQDPTRRIVSKNGPMDYEEYDGIEYEEVEIPDIDDDERVPLTSAGVRKNYENVDFRKTTPKNRDVVKNQKKMQWDVDMNKYLSSRTGKKPKKFASRHHQPKQKQRGAYRNKSRGRRKARSDDEIDNLSDESTRTTQSQIAEQKNSIQKLLQFQRDLQRKIEEYETEWDTEAEEEEDERQRKVRSSKHRSPHGDEEIRRKSDLSYKSRSQRHPQQQQQQQQQRREGRRNPRNARKRNNNPRSEYRSTRDARRSQQPLYNYRTDSELIEKKYDNLVSSFWDSYNRVQNMVGKYKKPKTKEKKKKFVPVSVQRVEARDRPYQTDAGGLYRNSREKHRRNRDNTNWI